jgi:hypothetical protein
MRINFWFQQGNAGTRKRGTICAALLAAIGLMLPCSLESAPGELRKQYWATSLSGSVDETILRGLNEAVAWGEVGWLDIDPKSSIPRLVRGINLVLYYVGGNCYIGDDCDRFPSSQPTGDRWGDTERALDLGDPETRKIAIEDLVAIVQQADKLALPDAIVGVHFDNVHRVKAEELAVLFNEFLAAIAVAREQGRIASTRRVGYVAKNNPKEFTRALDQKLLHAPPLYQINENARLNQRNSRFRLAHGARDRAPLQYPRVPENFRLGHCLHDRRQRR